MANRLQGRIAIVTGSDSGSGQATAEEFAISPGMVLTPMNQSAIGDPDVREQQVQSIPWKRGVEPWEIAKLAVYLASEEADYVTGQTFTSDGGLEMNMGQGA